MNDMKYSTNIIGDSGSHLETPRRRRTHFRKKYLHIKNAIGSSEEMPLFVCSIGPALIFFSQFFSDKIDYSNIFVSCLAFLLVIAIAYITLYCFNAAHRMLAPVALTVIDKTGFNFLLFHPYKTFDLNLPKNPTQPFLNPDHENRIFIRLYDLAVKNATICTSSRYRKAADMNGAIAVHRILMTDPHIPAVRLFGRQRNQKTLRFVLKMNAVAMVALTWLLLFFLFGFHTWTFTDLFFLLQMILLIVWLVITYSPFAIYRHAFAAAYYYILMDEWPWEKGK